MDAVCAGCGAVGTVHRVPEIDGRVCTACAALADECALDAPVDAAADAHEPWPTDAERRLRRHTYDPEHGRRAAHRRTRAHYTSMIHSAAVRMGYAYASERSAALWGQVGATLPRAQAAVAAAALYAVLRHDRRAVDVAAVAIAMEQPYDAVVRALRTLRTHHPVAFADAHVEDPGVYVGAHLAYLVRAAPAAGEPNGPLLSRVNLDEAQRLGAAIAQQCRLYELTGLDAQPFAFAIALHALEGATQRTLVIRALVPLATHAMAEQPVHGCTAAPASGSASTILARYAEVGKMLAAAVVALPWARPGKRQGARRHTALYVRDLVAYWAQHGHPAKTEAPRAWTSCFHAPGAGAARRDRRGPIPTLSPPPSPPSPPSLARRLQLTSAAIDALSDAQVDRMLFARAEFNSYLRPPAEQEVVRRLKGWDATERAATPPPAPLPIDTPRRLRAAPHLYTPLDPAELSEGSDWEM